MAWAKDMEISDEVIRTIADVTFKSVSTIEERREIAKQYRESLRLSKEYGRRLEMAAEGEVVE